MYDLSNSCIDMAMLANQLAETSQHHLCVQVGSRLNYRAFIITDIGNITSEQKQHLLQISKDPDIALWHSVSFIDIDAIKSLNMLHLNMLQHYWHNVLINLYGFKGSYGVISASHFYITWLQFCVYIEERHNYLNDNDFYQ